MEIPITEKTVLILRWGPDIFIEENIIEVVACSAIAILIPGEMC